MQSPTLSSTSIISDNPQLAAQLSCVLANADTYLTVLDGPRLTRPDGDAEVIRRLNATARVRSRNVILAGLPESTISKLLGHLDEKRRGRVSLISTWADAQASSLPKLPEVMSWGATRIGIGLLKALRRGSGIKFTGQYSPEEELASLSGHLVVCEEGEELSQVIAANYAYSLGAGLVLVPRVDRDTAESMLERFYSVQEDRSRSTSDALEEFKHEIRRRCNAELITKHQSVTFIGSGIPYGFAFPELPSTHLFEYPDLGIAVANGIATQQPRARGVDVAVLVDPRTTEAPEMRAAEHLLPKQGIFLRCYEGAGATVRNITEMVELYPYDLLVFATHCGDVSGWRWTYQYRDNEGLDRTLVVDIAIGVANTDEKDLLKVTQFMRFVSLDGVDWNDPNKSDKVHVGSAINSFMEQTRSSESKPLQPVKKEAIERVIGSAALRMRDHNYLTLPRSIADEGNPIVLNNACCSWHQLAMTFFVSGTRAYLGTLFPVIGSEAQVVTEALLGERFGELLPEALWAAQNDAFGQSVRRPYLICGVYPQAIRVVQQDVPKYLARRLNRATAQLLTHIERRGEMDEKTQKWMTQRVNYYANELKSLKDNWLS